MPDVTVPDSPSGAPSATTGWPPRTPSDDPIAITFSSCGGSTRSTARSVCGSRPVMVAGTVAPSENTTLTDPPPTAAEITWLLVRMYPSDLITSPDPLPPPPSGLVTLMVTTDGSTSLATDSTWQTAGLRFDAFRTDPDDPPDTADRAACGERQQPRQQQRLHRPPRVPHVAPTPALAI